MMADYRKVQEEFDRLRHENADTLSTIILLLLNNNNLKWKDILDQEMIDKDPDLVLQNPECPVFDIDCPFYKDNK